MANVKSSIKGMRVSARKRAYNKPIRTGIKTHLARAERLIQVGDIGSAREAVLQAYSAMDKAVGKGVVHANAAARHKSRLTKKLNKVVAASA